MTRDVAQVADETKFVVTIRNHQTNAVEDLTGATAIKLYFRTPSGTITAENAALLNTGSDGKVTFTAPDTLLASAGTWSIQAGWTSSGGQDLRSSVVEFAVRPNLNVT